MLHSFSEFIYWSWKPQANPQSLRYTQLTYSHPSLCKQAHTILGFKTHVPSYCSKPTIADWTKMHSWGCHQVDDNHWHSNGHILSLQNVPYPEDAGTWEIPELSDQPCSISGDHYPTHLSSQQASLNFRAGVCAACPNSMCPSYRANVSAQCIS